MYNKYLYIVIHSTSVCQLHTYSTATNCVWDDTFTYMYVYWYCEYVTRYYYSTSTILGTYSLIPIGIAIAIELVSKLKLKHYRNRCFMWTKNNLL